MNQDHQALIDAAATRKIERIVTITRLSHRAVSVLDCIVSGWRVQAEVDELDVHRDTYMDDYYFAIDRRCCELVGTFF